MAIAILHSDAKLDAIRLMTVNDDVSTRNLYLSVERKREGKIARYRGSASSRI